MTSVDDLTGLVLAGGDSTRFGDAEKALAPVDGRPLLGTVAATLGEATGRTPVIAVRGSAQRASFEPALNAAARWVSDHSAFEGPLAGIVGALPAIETPWVFVCGCDMPLLSTAAIRWQYQQRAERSDIDVIAPRHADGTLEPMHTAYRASAIEAAIEALAADAGVHQLLEALTVEPVDVTDAPRSARMVDSVKNANTQAGLAALLADC